MGLIGKIIGIFVLIIFVMLLIYHPQQVFRLLEIIWNMIVWLVDFIAEKGPDIIMWIWDMMKTITGLLADKIDQIPK